jgi:hypothetical protein
MTMSNDSKYTERGNIAAAWAFLLAIAASFGFMGWFLLDFLVPFIWNHVHVN